MLLAGVFIVAGTGKLFDLAGARSALFGFGVPQRVASVAGPLIPAAELATAAVLLLRPSAQWGAVAALALLVAFLGGILNALARGQAPDCHCFGIFHSSRAGPSAVYRNAALAGVAIFAVAEGPGPSLSTWVADRSAAELTAIGLGIAACLLGLLSFRLWAQVKGVRSELADVRETLAALPTGLPVGVAAPKFSIEKLGGGEVALDELVSRGRPVMLVFSEPACPPCLFLYPNLSRWQSTLSERLTIALITWGDPGDHEIEQGEGITDIGLQRGVVKVVDNYRVPSTPSAVVVSRQGTIASSVAQGGDAIEALVRLTLRRESLAAPAAPGPTSSPAAT
jgi:hypothetical protein